MMTSKKNNEAFVWIWLPDETQPVIAGKLEAENDFIHFNYGKSYLERVNDKNPAIPIYEPELPLRPGVLPLPDGLEMPNCIRDAAPDAWGRRVIINKRLGKKGSDTERRRQT
jgi:serine/threonine-protein kinase HipA